MICKHGLNIHNGSVCTKCRIEEENAIKSREIKARTIVELDKIRYRNIKLTDEEKQDASDGNYIISDIGIWNRTGCPLYIARLARKAYTKLVCGG